MTTLSGESSGKQLIAAVIKADGQNIGGETSQPGTVPHLQSADASLRQVVERTLRKDPNSELANHISGMLRNRVLFEVVGHASPDRSAIIGPWPIERL